ncbi:MAG: M1 family metallopeptidase [Flavobacteriaceae bacterium]
MKKIALFSFLVSGIFSFSQQYPKIDFTESFASLEINPVKQNVWGDVEYRFTAHELVDTLRIDAHKMSFDKVKINGKDVQFKTTDKEFLLFEGYKKGENSLTFSYEAFPVQAMYFVQKNYYEDVQIWTQGQGKYTSHWYPSFDDVNEKIIFNLDIAFHKDYTVLANGNLISKTEKDNQITWKYQMHKPMSSYLLMLAIGKFEKQSFTSKSGIPNDLWYHISDKDKFEPTYRYSKEIFDYLESEIAVSYPWQVYRQVPVWDFMYGGMENTTSTIFAQDYVVDEIGYNDRNYVNVNAHELAHQWFGDLVTAKTGKHHWLQEGFATFYALLAEREIFGEDYYYWRLYENAQKIQQAEASDDIPILSEKASSLSYYQKGAWALHVMREGMGKEKFRLAIKNYLNKHAFGNVETEDLFKEIRTVSDFDCETFSKNWLETHIFQKEEAYALLKKNAFIKQYIELQENPLDPKKDKKKILKILKSKTYYPVKELLVYQTANLPFEQKKDFIEAALNTNNLKVRQAVAVTLPDIPDSFRKTHETLLSDNSYVTKEIALFNLWNTFESERERYVQLSENWVGFEGRNLEVLHHTLSFVTTKSEEQQIKDYIALLNLSGTNYDATTRQNALEKLLNLELYTDEIFKSLAYGTSHFRWRFALFCREQIKKLIQNEEYKKVFQGEVLPQLPFKEKTILERILTNEGK